MSPTISRNRSQGRRTRTGGWRRRWAVVSVLAVVHVATAAAPVFADSAWAAPSSLVDVIDNLRGWLIGILVGLATLFLTIGGVRYLAADGDPGEVERAKRSLRNAAVGYSLAALAPLIMTVLQSLVG